MKDAMGIEWPDTIHGKLSALIAAGHMGVIAATCMGLEVDVCLASMLLRRCQDIEGVNHG